VATTPEQRLARLIRHAIQGWERARRDAQARARARSWLEAHPSHMLHVDALWLEALEGRGLLNTWLTAGAGPEAWTHSDVPLHSVLACHPFPDLAQWIEQRR